MDRLPPPSQDGSLTDAQVRDQMAELFATPTELRSTLNLNSTGNRLNDVPIVSLQVPIVRTQSPVFTNVLPNNNVLVPAVTGCAVPFAAGRTGRRIADGYWVMLPPLPPGQHILKFRGTFTSYGVENSVTYRITVPGTIGEE